jgi:hypothetical protein
MATNLIIIKLGNKHIVYSRTESGRFFDITGCQPVTDNRFGLNYNGVLRNANPVSAEYVTNLLAACSTEEYEHIRIPKGKAKARSKQKRRQQAHATQEVSYNQ